MTTGTEPPRVLIVDPDPGSLAALVAILGRTFDVLAASTPEQAWTHLAALPVPDLMLLEVGLPGTDGFLLCRAIRARAATAAMPIIFLTVHNEEADELAGFAAGAVDYITKPVGIPRLTARIRTQIEVARLRSTLAERNQALLEAERFRDEVERMTQHDLKGPLGAIIGLPSLLLQSDAFDPHQREILRSIASAGETMLNRINLSIDLFKMEQGFYEFHPERIDLLEVTRRVLGHLEIQCRNKALRLDVAVEGAPLGRTATVPVCGEDHLCYSVLSNLIRNAVEASPPGAALAIGFRRAGATVEIAITNAGEVAPTIRNRFFEKFVTAGKRHGTGFGTYLAKLATEIQGGRIEVDCRVPGRTTVWVKLPAA